MNSNRSFLVAVAALGLTLAVPATRADETQGTAAQAANGQGDKSKDAVNATKSGHHKDSDAPSAAKATEHQHGLKAIDSKSASGQTAKPAGPPAPAKADARAKSEATVTYVCPMHPEVTSDKKDRCPKCNMFLAPKK